ncbi:putative transposase element L1Md-A101/L1Md-A102/L1Md-A2 [Labeo rohita]|uniref:Putative transposase element L1Md-A101/L1Md-A102/L1Md-A2 n=1 Tax=Labeo rohita TaxID=84645 RepID=A0A498MTX2_LABRO|nr:putative transposase element L1Md-A101/L1Md-A102/L1Md-A2 [Labeo rohita]
MTSKTGGSSLERAKCDELSTPESVAIMAAINRLESGIHAKFDAHAAEIRGKISLVREEMHNKFSSLKEDLKSQNEHLTCLETATSEWTTSLHSLKPTAVSLQKEITSLQAKCLDLECLSRRSNLRLVGIPEGLEGPQPTKFIADALVEIFDLPEPPLLARAHRTLASKPAEGSRLRAFVICFHRYDVKEDIWQKASQGGQLKFRDKTVFVFPDFPPEIAKKWAAYYKVKHHLRSMPDVKYSLKGLTGFRITKNGAEHTFDTAAMAFVRQNLLPA